MKLASYKLELSVLYHITKADYTDALQYLSRLNLKHFENTTTKETFKRIKTQTLNQNVPSWSELLEDPTLADSTKEVLKSYKTKKQRFGFFDRAIEKLDYYRKARTLNDLAAYISQELSQDKVDLDKVMYKSADKLSKTNTSISEANFYRIGKNDNVEDKVKNILKGSTELYIPSGFADWDCVNKGIPASGLTVIGASTGAGKSLVSSQLALNLANAGYNVCIVPLEMGNDEMLNRWLANIDEFTMNDLMFSDKLPNKKKKQIFERYKQISERLAKRDAGITYYVPDYSASFDDIMLTLQPFNFNCIIIDYVGLLTDAEAGEQQWRSLAQVTRKAHVYGETHSTAIVLNAQVSQDNKIRYAGAIRENAKLAWIWSIPDSSKDDSPIKYVNVIPQKSRGQKPITWLMKLDFEHMRASCLTEQEKQSFLSATNTEVKQTDGLDSELVK